MLGASAGPTGPWGCARASVGSLGGGCSPWLVCWKGQLKDELAGGVWGFISCPRSAWPVPMPEAAAPSLGGHCWDPVTSLSFPRSASGVVPLPSWGGGWGLEPDPLCWAGADMRASCKSHGAAPPAGRCFALSTVLQGVGVGRYCGGKIPSSSVPAHGGCASPPG